jgi:protein tyrosine/serine phosphatase
MKHSGTSSWLRAVCAGSLLGLLLGVLTETLHVVLGPNLHVVIPQRIYRCAQPSERQLRHLAQAYGIRTLINLRGDCDDQEWYHEEKKTAAQVGVKFVDIGLWASLPPDRDEMRNFVKTLDNAEYPMLIHCHQGGDRTGLASALVLLLQTNTDFNEAKKQLSLRFGHNPIGRAAVMDRYLAAYERWLGRSGLRHSPAHLRHWIDEVYTVYDCFP